MTSWPERIAAAKVNGSFTEQDIKDANYWKDMIRQKNSMAITYGLDFHQAVAHNKFDDAKELYEKIQRKLKEAVE